MTITLKNLITSQDQLLGNTSLSFNSTEPSFNKTIYLSLEDDAKNSLVVQNTVLKVNKDNQDYKIKQIHSELGVDLQHMKQLVNIEGFAALQAGSKVEISTDIR